MELALKVIFDVSPALARCVEQITTAAPAPTADAQPTEEAAPVEAPVEAPAVTPEVTPEVTPADGPTVAEVVAAFEATAPQPVERKEKPEDVLPLLRQRFGIPDNKEDRTPEQQCEARNLSKCVVGLIKEVTLDKSARAITDLKTPEECAKFVERALMIARDVSNGTFQAMPF